MKRSAVNSARLGSLHAKRGIPAVAAGGQGHGRTLPAPRRVGPGRWLGQLPAAIVPSRASPAALSRCSLDFPYQLTEQWQECTALGALNLPAVAFFSVLLTRASSPHRSSTELSLLSVMGSYPLLRLKLIMISILSGVSSFFFFFKFRVRI